MLHGRSPVFHTSRGISSNQGLVQVYLGYRTAWQKAALKVLLAAAAAAPPATLARLRREVGLMRHVS